MTSVWHGIFIQGQWMYVVNWLLARKVESVGETPLLQEQHKHVQYNSRVNEYL